MSPEPIDVLAASDHLDRCRNALLERREVDAKLIGVAQKALRDYEEDPLYDNHQDYMAARSALVKSQTDISAAVEAFEHAVEAHVEARRAFEMAKAQHTVPDVPAATEVPATPATPTTYATTFANTFPGRPGFIYIPVPKSFITEADFDLKDHTMMTLEVQSNQMIVRITK